MGYEWIAAAASAAAAGVGAVAGQHPAKSRRYAKELAKFNNDLAIENWQRQNAYDAPKAQMQRYQEAGLNPNLIYGQQNTGGTIQSGSASFDADSMVPNEGKAIRGIADAIGTYQNIRSMQIQNSNANLVGDLTSEEIKAKQLDNSLKESVLPYQAELKALGVQDMTFKVLNQNIANYNRTLAQIDTEIEKKKNLISKTKLSDEQLNKVKEEVTNLQKQRDVMQAQIDYYNERVKDLQDTRPYRNYQMSANAGYTAARTPWVVTEAQDKHRNSIIGGSGVSGAITSGLKSIISATTEGTPENAQLKKNLRNIGGVYKAVKNYIKKRRAAYEAGRRKQKNFKHGAGGSW